VGAVQAPEFRSAVITKTLLAATGVMLAVVAVVLDPLFAPETSTGEAVATPDHSDAMQCHENEVVAVNVIVNAFPVHPVPIHTSASLEPWTWLPLPKVKVHPVPVTVETVWALLPPPTETITTFPDVTLDPNAVVVHALLLTAIVQFCSVWTGAELIAAIAGTATSSSRRVLTLILLSLRSPPEH
jgi:hypothetical protein